jgi:site-specific DNA recombinase
MVYEPRDAVPEVKNHQESESAPNEGLVQSVVRAHAWMHALRDGSYKSIEFLAEANQLHPKVVRQALRLAFLSPAVTSAILEGSQPAGLSLSQIPKLLPLPWTAHQQMLD